MTEDRSQTPFTAHITNVDFRCRFDQRQISEIKRGKMGKRKGSQKSLRNKKLKTLEAAEISSEESKDYSRSSAEESDASNGISSSSRDSRRISVSRVFHSISELKASLSRRIRANRGSRMNEYLSEHADLEYSDVCLMYFTLLC